MPLPEWYRAQTAGSPVVSVPRAWTFVPGPWGSGHFGVAEPFHSIISSLRGWLLVAFYNRSDLNHAIFFDRFSEELEQLTMWRRYSRDNHGHRKFV